MNTLRLLVSFFKAKSKDSPYFEILKIMWWVLGQFLGWGLIIVFLVGRELSSFGKMIQPIALFFFIVGWIPQMLYYMRRLFRKFCNLWYEWQYYHATGGKMKREGYVDVHDTLYLSDFEERQWRNSTSINAPEDELPDDMNDTRPVDVPDEYQQNRKS